MYKRKKIIEQFDFSSLLGGAFGGLMKDMFKGFFQSSDMPTRDKVEVQEETLDAQKKYIAQIILTGSASRSVKRELKDLGFLETLEDMDLSGLIRLSKSRLRKELEKGISRINLERILFK
jgi:hypothetical protein